MNLEQMRDRARHHIRDRTKAFITDTMLNAWLNDAQIDLAVRLRLVRREITASSASPIALPTDFIEVLHFRLDSHDVEAVDERAFWAAVDANNTSRRIIRQPFQGQLHFHPAASASYRLLYAARPQELVEDEDEPEIPIEFHKRLVEYAIAKAKWMEGEHDTGDRFMQLFEGGVFTPGFTDSGPNVPKGRSYERVQA